MTYAFNSYCFALKCERRLSLDITDWCLVIANKSPELKTAIVDYSYDGKFMSQLNLIHILGTLQLLLVLFVAVSLGVQSGKKYCRTLFVCFPFC